MMMIVLSKGSKPAICYTHNTRPRKRYDFENPIFVMEKILFNKKIAFTT